MVDVGDDNPVVHLFPHKLYRSRGVPQSPRNPGNIANLHKKQRDIVPEWIEGLNLRCIANLSAADALHMEWMLGNSTPYGLRLGGTTSRNANASNGIITKTPLVFGDINPSTLATNFRFCYHPLSQIKLETKIQASPLGKSVDGSSRSYLDEIVGTAEYLGESSTISLALYNPKCETGRMTIGFLGSFNNNFCAGVELLSEWMRNQVDYKLAIAMRYAGKRSSIAATVSKDGLDVSAWHQANDLWQFGASLILNRNAITSRASFYYQRQTRDCIIKGMINSDWTVGCTYQRHIENLATAFGFSLLYCIPKNKFHCGLKFELNSNLK